MTEMNVPYRLEFEVEVPGTPEQVWEAIATAKGNNAWFLRVEIEEREGGAIHFDMAPEGETHGSVTGWEPPKRVAYEETDWADGMPSPISPLATEMVIEARSGGTCVVRVVSSAFGTGADWEREMFADMEKGWLPFFDQLRLYLDRFAGQEAVRFEPAVKIPGELDTVREHIDKAVAELPDVTIETTSPVSYLLSVADGFVGVHYWQFEGVVRVRAAGYLFGPDAAAAAPSEEKRWEAWLQNLVSSSAAT